MTPRNTHTRVHVICYGMAFRRRRLSSCRPDRAGTFAAPDVAPRPEAQLRSPVARYFLSTITFTTSLLPHARPQHT